MSTIVLANNKPTLALSIRQPWAWLIAHGLKDIENRTWPTRFRGWCWIHASKGMTRKEYGEVLWFCEDIPGGIVIPEFNNLERGGIVGKMRITGCVTSSVSPWFFGPYGFEIVSSEAIPLQPCRGMLGFFRPIMQRTL